MGLGIAPAPDETTVLRFRHLLEEHGVGGLMLETGNIDLEVKGIRSRRARSWMRYPRAFVDQERKRRARSGDAPDQEGQPVVLRLKVHLGVDAKQGMVHTVVTTPANVEDWHMLPDLLHGEKRKVWGDGGYQGQTEAIQQAAPKAQDMTCRRTKFKNYVDELQKKNRTRACSRYLSASTMRAKLRNPRKSTSSFSNREKILRNPLSLRKSRSISLRFL